MPTIPFRTKKTHDPIVVVVKDRRYDCYGPDTQRSRYLTKMIETMGGINQSVEDGVYHFNAYRHGIRLHVSLIRIPDSQ